VKRVFKFDISEPLLLVFAKITGKRRKRPVRLVFDTGAFMTQITTPVIEGLGYTAWLGGKTLTN